MIESTPNKGSNSQSDQQYAILKYAEQIKSIENYETEMKRWVKGEVQEMIFTEYRLRHGVYGQRQEGVQMIRIKLPLGMASFNQMVTLADLAEELADGVSHITTRQDIQYHNVNILDTPEMMRRLAQVGITTNEACGNVNRNVCACTKTGVCGTEAFDCTADALAMASFLLNHPDAQDFGRKFKISYSGCSHEMCGLAMMHDLGAIAKTKTENGKLIEGFAVYIGGGLGAVPRQARLLYDFATREEMFPIARAISRVFTRHGERRNRAKARFKFVVDKFGIDEIRKMVDEERTKLTADPLRDQVLKEFKGYEEAPLKGPSQLNLAAQSETFLRWHQHNVQAQKQAGYSIVNIYLPLGDISSPQLRELAKIAKNYVVDTVRFSVEQNIVMRWVSNAELPALFLDLQRMQLDGVVQTMSDVTACPGTDSCKLGISASRGLAAVLQEKFKSELSDLSKNKALKIKISGCPNSCGQHHIADIGFFGSAQSRGGKTAPVFQMVLGGNTEGNGQSYGLALGKISPHRIPEALQTINQVYNNQRQEGESLASFVHRIGKNKIKEELAPLMNLPAYEEHPEFYTDSRQHREFAVNTGKGECAGELVPRTEFVLDECDRMNALATQMLEDKRYQEAYKMAANAMEKAAKALLLTQGYEEFGNYVTMDEFKVKFFDTGVFFKQFAEYYFNLPQDQPQNMDPTNIRYTVEQATLFVEEANVVYSKISQKASAIHATEGATAL